MSWYRLAQAEECFKEKGLLAVQSVGQCLIFSHACNWTVSTLCAGPANLRWMWGLEGPLDIQTLHNYGNSGLTFRAWPGLLWEAAAESQAMPAALAESKGVKKAGHRSSCCSPTPSASELIPYSRHPCTWCPVWVGVQWGGFAGGRASPARTAEQPLLPSTCCAALISHPPRKQAQLSLLPTAARSPPQLTCWKLMEDRKQDAKIKMLFKAEPVHDCSLSYCSGRMFRGR